jgi:DnaD/phage-associated family protein|nr:MAG TPA: Replication initiation and membrane attachment [Caudoviricetes sp.]DAU54038.1 MAG TPA: Replication initiation and membrane attachment [Caudoviricetes sp.]
MIIHFDSNVASKVGVDGAIMLNNLQFWIVKNKANKKHFYDNNYWTYNSIDAFTEIFPFWSRRQIERILNNLKKDGYIETGNYNKLNYDRTLWYSLTEKAWILLSPNGEMEITKPCNDISPNGEITFPQTVKPIPYNNTDKKPDLDIYINENLPIMISLYEKNIGKANGKIGEYLIKLSNKIDIPLFEKALEICTKKNILNFAYLQGIIKQWLDKDITTLEQLTYELQNKKQSTKSISQNKKFIPKYKTGAGAIDNHIMDNFNNSDELEAYLLAMQREKGI